MTANRHILVVALAIIVLSACATHQVNLVETGGIVIEVGPSDTHEIVYPKVWQDGDDLVIYAKVN